jgi:hypothetical protein
MASRDATPPTIDVIKVMTSVVLVPLWSCEPAAVLPDEVGLLASELDGSPVAGLGIALDAGLGIALDAVVEDVPVELDGLESVPDRGPTAGEVRLGIVLDGVAEDVVGELGELESVSG